MLNHNDNNSDSGFIKIHFNAIASIASIAALEVEGVKEICKRPYCKIFEVITKYQPCGIKVEKDKNEEFTVTIPLVVKYGYSIPDIASKVQENVRGALDKMTSLTIKDVNIKIKGIERG